MIHKACMPVYMNSGKIVADGRDGTGRVGKSKVLQEVLADLKTLNSHLTDWIIFSAHCATILIEMFERLGKIVNKKQMSA